MKKWQKIYLTVGALVGSVAMPAGVNASDENAHAGDETIEEVIVWGRALSQNGEASSASQGLVGYADFEVRPMQRVGELTEVVPGMVATQHSGEGKANQYYLRGMNLDHGTDFSVYFEGVPVNLRSHAHGQGYLDINFLIPEIVSTVSYRKGPYYADRGDFSSAGTAQMNIYDRLDKPFVEFSAGGEGYRRLLGAGSLDIGEDHLLVAVEGLRNDGPWQLPAEVDKRNVVAKYSGHSDQFDYRFLATSYHNEWNSTDQLPRRLVDSGGVGRFGFIDPTLGGESSRLLLLGGIENEQLTATAFATRYKLNLFGNFTYFLDDPINSDQHEQVDRRWVYGGSLVYRYALHDQHQVELGTDLRFDDVAKADLYATSGGVRRGVVRDDSIAWLSVGGYVQLTSQWTPRLRSVLGLRVDHYDFDVDANLDANSGDDAESKLTPKFALAYTFNDYFEGYVNWGKGFHSNDARGVVASVDPRNGDLLDPVELFVDQLGAEAGVRFEGWQGLTVSLAAFYLESDSDLLFVGDSGATEPAAGSERVGLEFSGFWQFNERWQADISASFVDSEFVDVPSGEDHIPNAHGRVISAGIGYGPIDGLSASLRLRHFGDAPLIEDDSVSHGSTTLFNLGMSYEWGNWQFGAQVLNLFDAEDDDIAYWFESRLAGEAAPVEDVHFHPVQPRTLRFSVRRQFGG